MKILCLYDKSGPKYHRVMLPSYLMDAELLVSPWPTHELLKEVDIVFFNRAFGKPVNGSMQEVLNEWRKTYGVKIVCDIDDHWKLGRDHILFDHYQEHGLTEIMEDYISYSDAVFVTHERLYYEVLPLNKNCHVLPNAIPNFGQFTVTKTESDKIRFFWAGGVTHKKDIQILTGPIRRINRPVVQWVMGGFVKDNPEWLAMAHAFTGGGRFDHDLIQSEPVENYFKMYSRCDISMVPLLDTTFNTYKSNLKILEAARIGAPVIVSMVHPYLGFPGDVVNYVETQRDWHRHAVRLINNPELIKEQGERLKEYCDKFYNFDKINLERKQILCHLITKQSSKSTEVYTRLDQVPPII